MSIAKQLRVLLPYERLEYRTALSSAQVVERLGTAIEPYKLRFLGISDKPYEGVLSGNTFEVERIVGVRKINPVITGEIVEHPEGVRIYIAMHLDQMLAMLLVPWVIISAITLLIGLWGIPIFFAAFFYTIIIIQFKYEAAKSKRFFGYLFGVGALDI